MNFCPCGSPPEPEEINTSNSIIAPEIMLKDTSSSAGRNFINGGFSDHRKVEMIEEEIYTSDEFRMYAYKIKRCPRTRSHDWTECPCAHRGEKAQRRDPRKHRYSAIVCAAFRDTGGTCPKGDACEHAHGVFEYWLHPAKYRTRACNAGNYCQRKVCFFAHSPDQLRPDTKYHNLHNHNHNKLQYYCRSTTTTTATCIPVPGVAAAAAAAAHDHQAADHHDIDDDEYDDQYNAGREYCDQEAPKINEGIYNIKLTADREVMEKKEKEEEILLGMSGGGGNNYMNSSDYILMKKLRGLSLICRPDDHIDNNIHGGSRSSTTHHDIDIINDDQAVVNNINSVIKGGSSSNNNKKSNINYVNGGGGGGGYAAAAAAGQQYYQIMSMRPASAGLGTLEALSGDEELERLGWISDLLQD